MIEIPGDEKLNELVAEKIMKFPQEVLHNENVTIPNYSGDRNHSVAVIDMMMREGEPIREKFLAQLQQHIQSCHLIKLDEILLAIIPYEICKAALKALTYY